MTNFQEFSEKIENIIPYWEFWNSCRIFGILVNFQSGARCSSVVRVFAHSVMGRRIHPSWGGPIELFFVPASAPRLV